MANLYIGLVHYPIMNKHKDVITTAITNYDIHDIARASITYDVSKYFLIHNIPAQRELAATIMEHWKSGFGSTYNPDRKDAFTEVELVNSIRKAVDLVTEAEGVRPIIATTDARTYDNTITYSAMRKHLENDSRPVLVLFGTGYGMTKETMEEFDCILEPIYGHGEYNHLSVRSAVSIILDRLRGEAWWEKN
ncbi:MAG: RNA methyltransferase [Veillonella sp.]|uniref:RNA methyltransferase n=1 Tax=Veillonella sp. TaxID=1926307 RepID=UPI001B63BB72|nr:RNA methyltransferase [Veillonella sp.]MBP6923718.1 RNA methyltransferase [Veillonella sp.]